MKLLPIQWNGTSTKSLAAKIQVQIMATTATSSLSQNTLAPMGAYLNGQPNGNSTSAQTYFEQQYTAFSKLMGTRPGFYDAYTDFTQVPSAWGSNAGWGAWSFALTGNSFVGPGSGTIPVVGVPMADTAIGQSYG